MELVVCVHCNRHVGESETACPFCTRALPVQRPQFVLAAKLTRAAIFSAAVVACKSNDAGKPAPAPTHQGSSAGTGSDDLEQMLDTDQHVVDHPAPIDAALAPDAAMIAAAADAGVPVDAGVDPERARKLAELRRKKLEQKRIEDELQFKKQEQQRVQIRVHEQAKPYGAPPARRRVV